MTNTNEVDRKYEPCDEAAVEAYAASFASLPQMSMKYFVEAQYRLFCEAFAAHRIASATAATTAERGSVLI